MVKIYYGAVHARFKDWSGISRDRVNPCSCSLPPRCSRLILPATHTGKQYYGFKQATTFAGNTQKGLPTVLSQYFLYSNVTGQLLSIMDFLDMTNFKTGAAAAIATKYLALPDAHVVGVIGSGTLSRSVLAALLPCRSKAQKLRASSSNSLCFLTPGRAKGLIAFGSQWAGPTPRRGLCCRYFNAVFSYKNSLNISLLSLLLICF